MQKQNVMGVSPLEPNHRKKSPPLAGGIQLQASILVDQSPNVCYAYWRDFENLPRFMKHVESVATIDRTHSHWMVEGPADTSAEWDAEIIEDVPNERISWRSSENAQIDNAGSVQFAPEDNGRKTLVKVVLTYNPTLGPVGEAFAELFEESPDKQLADTLADFKHAVEKGE